MGRWQGRCRASGADPDAGAGDGRRLSDLAYDRVLELLLQRRLPAGAFVSQNALVDLVDVPVAPLRDALRVLEAEGVLKIHPRSGIEFVKPGSRTHPLHLSVPHDHRMRCRPRLCGNGADREFRDASGRAPGAGVAVCPARRSLAAIVDELERLEARLHGSIVGALANPLIDSSYARIHYYLRLVRLERSLTAPLAMRSLNEHLRIIEACAARDPDRAEAEVRAHFTAALQRHMGLA